jgi:hypothetical protein
MCCIEREKKNYGTDFRNLFLSSRKYLLGVGILERGNLLDDEWVICIQQDAKSCVKLQYSQTMKTKY